MPITVNPFPELVMVNFTYSPDWELQEIKNYPREGQGVFLGGTELN